MNRRDFFKIVATTGATAAVAGCQPATEQILPLVVPNEHLVPGVAAWFATVCRECPAGCGVLARNREGRVVKLEGNPDHPVNHGALCGRGQAALQGLYNPDRFAGPLRREGDALRSLSWDDALKLFAEKVSAARGANKARGIAIVTQLENGSAGVLADRSSGPRRAAAGDARAFGSRRSAPPTGRRSGGRDPVLRAAGRRGRHLLRRRLRGDAAVQRRCPRSRGCTPSATVAPARSSTSSRASPDGLQRRRVDP